MEYEKSDGTYLEFEINDSNVCEVFTVNSQGEERLFSIQTMIESINEVVCRFYG